MVAVDVAHRLPPREVFTIMDRDASFHAAFRGSLEQAGARTSADSTEFSELQCPPGSLSRFIQPRSRSPDDVLWRKPPPPLDRRICRVLSSGEKSPMACWANHRSAENHRVVARKGVPTATNRKNAQLILGDAA